MAVQLDYAVEEAPCETIEKPISFRRTTVAGHVLVVDDENGPRQALRMLLKEEHEVHLAPDVSTAIDILERESINLIITDLRMPNQSGVELLQFARKRYPEIPVLILTGYGHLHTAMTAVEYGAFAYLEKPFDNHVMMRYVEAALDRNRQELERRSMERLAIEANRFETLGRLVSGMMHDMGTPLAVISGQVEIVLGRPNREDLEDRLHTVLAQVRHCNDMVKSTMGFLRNDSNAATLFCINDVVETCLDVGQPCLRKRGIRVTKDFADPIAPCPGDVVLVRQAVLNLINNACHAMDNQEAPCEIILRTWMEDGHVCLSVEDTGPGVPREHRQRIFDTFFTTKGEKGTGLGLSVVKYVMRRHDGSITLADRPSQGAQFILRFPALTHA